MSMRIISSLTKIVKLYARGRFIACAILVDMEFEKVSYDMDLVQVNTTAYREHVGKINCRTRVTT